MKTVDLLGRGGSQRRVLTRADADEYIKFVTKFWMFDRIKHHVKCVRARVFYC